MRTLLIGVGLVLLLAISAYAFGGNCITDWGCMNRCKIFGGQDCYSACTVCR
jgi:hypothetical protein